jgi:hypothetical protein
LKKRSKKLLIFNLDAGRLPSSVAGEIEQFRHRMRCLGQRGACYEVSQFIQWRFGLPAQEGVYQTAAGEPVCLHRWNLLANGDILDGTADQFCEGEDISLLSYASPRAKRYRPIWTHAFNPDTIAWHQGTVWTGLPDQEWWEQNGEFETATGWWLQDVGPFVEWRLRMDARYESFRAKPVLLRTGATKPGA